MDRNDVPELHYITHSDNLASIVSRGLMSNNAIDAEGIDGTSVANPDVQSIRATKEVAGRPLHDYVNLYFNARNLMMYDILTFDSIPPVIHEELCVLGIHPDVLDMEGAIIADGNAAQGLTRFHPSPEGLSHLERKHVYTKLWHVDDPRERTLRRSAVMSELLVPDRIPPDIIEKAYVCCSTARDAIEDQAHGIPLTVNNHLFFNSGARSHD